jgi:hypothetical protein
MKDAFRTEWTSLLRCSMADMNRVAARADETIGAPRGSRRRRTLTRWQMANGCIKHTQPCMFLANGGTLGRSLDGEHGSRAMPPGAGDEGGGTQVFRWRATLG